MSFTSYDNFVDSGIGWIGEVPAHWEVKQLRRCLLEHRQGYYSSDGYVDDGVRLLRITDIHEYGEIEFSDCPRVERKADQDEFYLASGDFLFARTGGAGTFGLVKHLTEPAIYASYLIRFRFSKGVHPRFLAFYFMTNGFQNELKKNIHGGVNQNVHAEDIKSQYVSLPPEREQAQIMAFLDRETGKIDELAEEQTRLIELLKEKRQAVISHAVTKGLDPNVPMKDSGVDWLGDVPAHWSVVRNKAVFFEKDVRSLLGQEELLSVSHLTGVTRRSEKNVNMIMAETLEGYKICAPGDLVINTMWAWMGALGVSPQRGVVSPSYNVYSCRESGTLSSNYYDLLCRMPRHVTAIRANSTGVWESRLRLYPDAFFDMLMPLPPYAEQKRIASFLEIQTKRFDCLIAEAGRAIALLQERRSALISAAVTGKIDVRGLVAAKAEAA